MIVNGQSLTIVGVAPRGFDGTTLGAQPEVYVPITLRALMEPGFKGFDNRRTYWVYLFARLKPGVSIEQATAGINAPYKAIINDVEAPLQKGMSEQTMKRFRARAAGRDARHARPELGERRGKGPLTLLLGVTGLVLLIACANIANLLLARAASRASEMAVRLSLGASRWQLVVQLLTESLVLAVLGGAAGLLVARWTLDLIVSILPDDARSHSTALDAQVLLFAAALTIGTGLLFGCSRRSTARVPICCRAEGPVGQGHGHQGRGAVPHVARHGADRAVDGAAGVGRPLHEEPVQHQPRRSRAEGRQRRHLRHLSGAQRLHAGALAGALPAPGGRTGGLPGVTA